MQLRIQRIKRPRILFSHSVGSKTGDGISIFQDNLWALMEDQRLFPHVGAPVPLSYAMLSMLAEEGRGSMHTKDSQVGSHERFSVFRGNWRGVHFNMKMRTLEIEFRSDGQGAAVFSKFKCPMVDKGYYEIEIIGRSGIDETQECDNLMCQFGFTSPAVQRDLTQNSLLGTCPPSWVVGDFSDFIRVSNTSTLKHIVFSPGDVIGLACDLQNHYIVITVNGNSQAPYGRIFDLSPEDVRHGLFPVFCGNGTKIRYNLGQEPFKQTPPSADYRGFTEFRTSHLDCDRAFWEIAVAKHVEEKVTAGLRLAFGDPFVRLDNLEKESLGVGMTRTELLSALRFLHAGGSVLHYGKYSMRDRVSQKVHDTVILQPQFIINAIKYVIRESMLWGCIEEISHTSSLAEY